MEGLKNFENWQSVERRGQIVCDCRAREVVVEIGWGIPEYRTIKFEPARGERCNKSSKFEMPSLTGSAGERPGRPGSPGRWGIATEYGELKCLSRPGTGARARGPGGLTD